nr:17-beta-hydroxysteroid dehydrogenase 14 isoform X1 [Chrysemys picta bellii]
MASGLRYPGKVAVVTGGSRGIGEAIVREFVRQGTHVVFCAPEAEGAAGRALEQALRDSGGPGDPHFQPCDVTSERDIQALIAVTRQRYGRIDCLVNNAGRHPPEEQIDDVTSQHFRELLEVNLVGYFLTAKFALPYLRETRGNIINISSLVGIIGQRQAVPYVATKYLSWEHLDPHVGGDSRADGQSGGHDPGWEGCPAAGPDGHAGGVRPGCDVPGCRRHLLHRDRPAAEWGGRAGLWPQELAGPQLGGQRGEPGLLGSLPGAGSEFARRVRTSELFAFKMLHGDESFPSLCAH